MEDSARRTQEWKDRNPLKRWRRRKGFTTQLAVLVLAMGEARILQLEAGQPPTNDEMKTITQRTGITQAVWATWEGTIPRGPTIPPG
jgi:hypothetical protein